MKTWPKGSRRSLLAPVSESIRTGNEAGEHTLVAFGYFRTSWHILKITRIKRKPFAPEKKKYGNYSRDRHLASINDLPSSFLFSRNDKWFPCKKKGSWSLVKVTRVERGGGVRGDLTHPYSHSSSGKVAVLKHWERCLKALCSVEAKTPFYIFTSQKFVVCQCNWKLFLFLGGR